MILAFELKSRRLTLQWEFPGLLEGSVDCSPGFWITVHFSSLMEDPQVRRNKFTGTD